MPKIFYRYATADLAALAVVVGLAGAGKSTLPAAARAAWERAGHRVMGAALAGPARRSRSLSSASSRSC